MIKRIASGLSALVISLSALAVLAPAMVSAAVDTCTWTGATDNHWSTIGNWTGCSSAAPDAGDSLVFPASVETNTVMDNDLTADISFASITFSGSSNNIGYTVDGHAITVASGITNTSTFTSGGGKSANMEVNIAFSSSVTLQVDTGAGLNLGGVVSGSGAITKTGDGQLYLRGVNTFTGSLLISAGNVLTYDTAGLGATSAGTTISDGAGLQIITTADDVTIAEPLTINSSTFTSDGYTDGALWIGANCGQGGCAPGGKVTLSGDIVLGADVKVSGSAETHITGALSGNHTISIMQGGDGTLVVTSSDNTSQTSNGTSQAPLATVTYDQNDPDTNVSIGTNVTGIVTGTYKYGGVSKGGTLKGTGTFAEQLYIAEGAIVAPGMSPGCITSNGLSLNGEYQFEAKGATACTEYDQLKVSGDVVTLKDGTDSTSTLKVTFLDNYNPVAGTKFVIISNGGTDAVDGTFKGLAEGATFEGPNKSVLKISYKGGDGNDVELTVVTAGTPNTGFSTMLNNPAGLIAATTLAAGAILIMSRRFKPATKRARR